MYSFQILRSIVMQRATYSGHWSITHGRTADRDMKHRPLGFHNIDLLHENSGISIQLIMTFISKPQAGCPLNFEHIA